MNPIIQFTNCNINKIIYHSPNFYQEKGATEKRVANVMTSSFANLQRKRHHPFQKPCDEAIFNQLIKIFEESKQKNKLFLLDQALNRLQFYPQYAGIYMKWLKRCKARNHLELATLFFNHFKSNRAIVKSKKDCLLLYTALVDICCKNKRLDLALSYFREMKKLGIKPNKVGYNILIYAYGMNQRLDLALDYFREMVSVGIKLSQESYCALIRVCGKNHQPKLALSFWERMKKERLPIDDVNTLSAVVDAFSWNFPLQDLEKELPPLLVGRVKAIQKKGEKEGKFDFHTYSHKLAEWILKSYLDDKKDTSSLFLVSGIGKHNKSRKLFSMKSYLTAFLENYPLEGYTLTIQPVRGNAGRINKGMIQLLFSKKERTDSLVSSLSGLIHSLSSFSQILRTR